MTEYIDFLHNQRVIKKDITSSIYNAKKLLKKIEEYVQDDDGMNSVMEALDLINLHERKILEFRLFKHKTLEFIGKKNWII